MPLIAGAEYVTSHRRRMADLMHQQRKLVISGIGILINLPNDRS